MVTSFKEATGDMVMYSFEFVLFFFVLYPTLDQGKCQNMVRPADCRQVRAASGRWRSCVIVRIGGPEAGTSHLETSRKQDISSSISGSWRFGLSRWSV